MKNNEYIPALGYDVLTSFYDPVVRLTTREKSFKTALVEQMQIGSEHLVLDLACGSGTLGVLLKKRESEAEIIGVDGDPKILKIARKKARKDKVEIRFDEAVSFALPYANAFFDRVVSSLFFHHLTRENKLRTLLEVFRILKPTGELHIADWGLPANFLMKLSSKLIQILDGFETTADSFGGLLPELIQQAGFENVEQTNRFNTVFGTIRLLRARKM